MFLNAGIVFLMGLSIHTPTTSLQNKRDCEVDNVDVPSQVMVKAARTDFVARLLNQIMYCYSSSV